MKISTRGRYALRLMLDVALHRQDEPVSLKAVSQRQNISIKYLEQLVTALTRSGLLKGMRGAGGGYLLTREPEEYTVGEILRTLEGDFAPVECAQDGACCDRMDVCVTIDLWRDVKNAVDGVLDSVTLADLEARYWEKQGKERPANHA